MLSHNQSMEVLRKRSMAIYEKVIQEVKAKLGSTNAEALKLNRKNQQTVFKKLDKCIVPIGELVKIAREALKIEKETS